MKDEKKTTSEDGMSKELKERSEKSHKLRDEIDQRLKQKDYLLTVIQEGETMMSCGNPEKMVYPQRFYDVCSLEEIPEMIKFMKQPFWRHPDLKDGMSKKEVSKIPFEEKEWGIYSHIDITPLTKEKEEQFLKDVESGFLQSWRDIEEFERHKDN
jgi:hypothetical protein